MLSMHSVDLAAYPILTAVLRWFAGKHPSSIENLLADEVKRNDFTKCTKMVDKLVKNVIILL